MYRTRRNREKKDASRNCSRELHEQFTFFFLKSSILAIKPFPSKIVHSASIPLPPLTVLLNHLTIIVRRRSFFFPILGRTFVKETRYHEARVSGTRVQWYGRSTEESRMRPSLSVGGGLMPSEVAGHVTHYWSARIYMYIGHLVSLFFFKFFRGVIIVFWSLTNCAGLPKGRAYIYEIIVNIVWIFERIIYAETSLSAYGKIYTREKFTSSEINGNMRRKLICFNSNNFFIEERRLNNYILYYILLLC